MTDLALWSLVVVLALPGFLAAFVPSCRGQILWLWIMILLGVMRLWSELAVVAFVWLAYNIGRARSYRR